MATARYLELFIVSAATVPPVSNSH